MAESPFPFDLSIVGSHVINEVNFQGNRPVSREALLQKNLRVVFELQNPVGEDGSGMGLESSGLGGSKAAFFHFLPRLP